MPDVKQLILNGLEGGLTMVSVPQLDVHMHFKTVSALQAFCREHNLTYMVELTFYRRTSEDPGDPVELLTNPTRRNTHERRNANR
jgi:hypothetical protein